MSSFNFNQPLLHLFFVFSADDIYIKYFSAFFIFYFMYICMYIRMYVWCILIMTLFLFLPKKSVGAATPITAMTVPALHWYNRLVTVAIIPWSPNNILLPILLPEERVPLQ